MRLSAIIHTFLIRHCSSRHLESVARWLGVGFGGKLFPVGWPRNPATRIQFAMASLDADKLSLDEPRSLCILLQKVEPCNNWQVSMWRTTLSTAARRSNCGGWHVESLLDWWCSSVADHTWLVNTHDNSNNKLLLLLVLFLLDNWCSGQLLFLLYKQL